MTHKITSTAKRGKKIEDVSLLLYSGVCVFIPAGVRGRGEGGISIGDRWRHVTEWLLRRLLNAISPHGEEEKV